MHHSPTPQSCCPILGSMDSNRYSVFIPTFHPSPSIWIKPFTIHKTCFNDCCSTFTAADSVKWLYRQVLTPSWLFLFCLDVPAGCLQYFPYTCITNRPFLIYNRLYGLNSIRSTNNALQCKALSCVSSIFAQLPPLVGTAADRVVE